MVEGTKKLRELASKASPGPWVYTRGGHVECAADDNQWFRVFDCASPEDAAFIAAACPTVILALLDELDALHRFLNAYENTERRDLYEAWEAVSMLVGTLSRAKRGLEK